MIFELNYTLNQFLVNVKTGPMKKKLIYKHYSDSIVDNPNFFFTKDVVYRGKHRML